MKIITKNGIKDYYDYLQGVRGMDELVVYDRRDCTFIKGSTIKEGDYPQVSFFDTCHYGTDKPKLSIRRYLSKKIENHDGSYKGLPKFVMEGEVCHPLIEIGFHDWIFEVERYLDDNEKLCLDVSLVKKFENKTERLSEAPINIGELKQPYYHWGNVLRSKTACLIQNPIMLHTWIPRFIPAEEVWDALYEYISSLNDKDIVDNRTDIEKVESHGFDKKTSFRKM